MPGIYNQNTKTQTNTIFAWEPKYLGDKGFVGSVDQLVPLYGRRLMALWTFTRFH
jgi:hypothetical protein